MRGMRRPVPVVVPESALVSGANVIAPAPDHFTHEIRRRQAYYDGARRTARRSGTFEAGTRVVLMVRGKGPLCRVVDGQGRYVLTACAGLRPLASRR